jgi:hypothetical protein
MAADFKIVKSLVGDTYEIDYATADEALEAGDLCNFDGDNELEKVDDNATETDLVIVLTDADADATGIPFVWLDPWILIEGTAKGTVGDVGDWQSIDVTSNVIKVETSTLQSTAKFVIRDNPTTNTDLATGKVRLTSLMNLGIS